MSSLRYDGKGRRIYSSRTERLCLVAKAPLPLWWYRSGIHSRDHHEPQFVPLVIRSCHPFASGLNRRRRIDRGGPTYIPESKQTRTTRPLSDGQRDISLSNVYTRLYDKTLVETIGHSTCDSFSLSSFCPKDRCGVGVKRLTARSGVVNAALCREVEGSISSHRGSLKIR